MANLKRRLFSIHSYTGLIAGIFILAISLAGCFVALLKAYEKAFEGEKLFVVPQAKRMSYDSLFALAKLKVPNFYLYDFARLPQAKNEALELLYFPDGTYHSVFIDPYTGNITGYIDNNLSKWMLKFHWSLGIGSQGYAGAILVFLVAMCMLVSIITGFIIYRKHILKALLFQVKITANNNFSGLHRIIGVWSMLFMLVVFSTGAFINYHIINGDYSYPGGKQLTQKPKQPLTVSVDSCIEKATRRLPNFIPTSFSFPQLMGGDLGVFGKIKNDNSFYTPGSGCMFNANTCELKSISFGKNDPLGSKIETVLGNLHYGNFGGLWMKIIYALFSFLSAMMPITGFLLWKKRTFKFSQKK